MSQHARNNPEQYAALYIPSLPYTQMEGDWPDDCCDRCGANLDDGCIHYSECCGAPVIDCTDFCSECKEHTAHH